MLLNGTEKLDATINTLWITLSLAERLILLEKSTFEFHLTGSRYFGTTHSSSDWDFFVQDDPAVRDFLLQNGFLPESTGLYHADLNNAEVWYSLPGPGVHIQIVKRADVKILLQNLVRKHFPPTIWAKFSKVQQKAMWRLLWDLVMVYELQEEEIKENPDEGEEAEPTGYTYSDNEE